MSMIKSLKTGLKYVVLTTSVVIGAILYEQIRFPKSTNEVPRKNIFSVEELSTYNGIQQDKLYLAVVGNVFDVTLGNKHYMKGSSYHYFIGKDGTRALVTGNFKDESSDKDHVLDLPCNDLLTILHWRQTFKQKYTYIGLLIGRYYDENGAETSYMNELKQRLKQCRIEKEEAKKQEQLYPPCNMAWTEEEGAKVWCTKSSGGVVRDWVGVPRQMYTPGQEKPLCVCVNIDKINSSQLKEYHDCPNTSAECLVVER
ncbi:neuferricin [Maniola hyperantus]|uniref:neuferricin n=1 Tax=Aphantopus hyperantus TaxID=2795564 RepID=UPI001568BC07|nr:neuferricin [Maniola hyperantus]